MVLPVVGGEDGAGPLLLSVLMETGHFVLSAASWELLDGHKGGRKKGDSSHCFVKEYCHLSSLGVGS